MRRINIILRLFIGAAILFVLFRIVPYSDLISQLRKADLRLIVFAFGLFVFIQFLAVRRWQVCLFSLDVKLKYKDLFFPFFCGLFFNIILPLVIAQDVFRAGALKLHKEIPLNKAAASLVIDRFSGFFALSAVVTISFIFVKDLINSLQGNKYLYHPLLHFQDKDSMVLWVFSYKHLIKISLNTFLLFYF